MLTSLSFGFKKVVGAPMRGQVRSLRYAPRTNVLAAGGPLPWDHAIFRQNRSQAATIGSFPFAQFLPTFLWVLMVESGLRCLSMDLGESGQAADLAGE
jgi:hypothetical protein